MKQEGKAKKVFICSPFRPKGETAEEREVDLQRNRQLASKACKLAVNCGYNPLAPHLFFPEFLSDEDPDEREQGIQLGQEWLAESDELWVVGNRITEGMKMEIGLADQLGIPMKHVTFRRITREQYQKEQRELIEQKEQKNQKEGAKVSTEQKKETSDKNVSILEQLKAGIDGALEEMEKAMDENFMETGKALAELFRALCMAALKLPNMELHTELMCVTNTDEGLSVYFDRDRLENGDRDEFDDPDDDEYDRCDHCDHSDRHDDHNDYDYGDFDDEEEWSYEED